jgi:hypothetical protein
VERVAWRKLLQLDCYQRIGNLANSSGQSTGFDKIGTRIRIYQQPARA